MALRIRDTGVRQRLRWLSLLIIGLHVAIVGRLIHLQVLNGNYYYTEAHDIRDREKPLPSERGTMVTRDGQVVAVMAHSADLVCDPALIKRPDKVAAELAKILGTPPSMLLTGLLPQATPGPDGPHCSVVQADLTADAVGALQESIARGKFAALAPGMRVRDRSRRAYPGGAEMEHLAGYVERGEHDVPVGKGGLELSQEDYLRGRPGLLKGEVDRQGRPIASVQGRRISPVDGYNVRLTIDSFIQHTLFTELDACCKKYNPAGATAIAMDPNTGDILGMVSWPYYEMGHRPGPKSLDVEKLRNRALMLYEPGSTLKIITIAAGLNDGIIHTDTCFHCGGKLSVGGRTVRCVLHGDKEANGHGDVTPERIIEHSCNVGTAQVGVAVGLARLARYLEQFGLVKRARVGLPGDRAGTFGQKVAGLQGKAAVVKVSRVAFGQSVMVSPIGLARAYCAIANGGAVMRPRLIEGYCDSAGKLVKACPPEKVGTAVTRETAAELRRYLRAVVVSGTGKAAAVPGYTVAGKTGTAQKVARGERSYSREKFVASFAGFLPATAPRAVILVVVDEPKGSIYGAQVAAPVFKSIAQRLMWHWRIAPDDPASLATARAAGGRDAGTGPDD